MAHGKLTNCSFRTMTTGTPASAAKAAAAAPPAINPLDDPNIMSRGWRRFVHLSSYVVCAGMFSLFFFDHLRSDRVIGAAFYLVFEQDFGPGEHVFSPVRCCAYLDVRDSNECNVRV